MRTLFDTYGPICYAESVSQGVPFWLRGSYGNQLLAPDLDHTSVGNVTSGEQHDMFR